MDVKEHKCEGCGMSTQKERFNAVGISTGYWCDKCFESENYPYTDIVSGNIFIEFKEIEKKFNNLVTK